YPDSNRLIALDYGIPARNMASGMNSMTWQLYFQFVDHARSLEAVGAYNMSQVTLTGSGDPERILATNATPSLQSVLRVTPGLGRWFTEEEGVPGAPAVAVLSHGLWVRRFGRDVNITARSVSIDGVPTAVVGVMPASFAFPNTRVEMWVPAQSTR